LLREDALTGHSLEELLWQHALCDGQERLGQNTKMV
jgi:hypothetical protein